MQVPVLAKGIRNNNKLPFEEDTETLAINAHGAMILLSAPVAAGQKISLRHGKTQEEQECKVVYLGPTQDGKTQVALEFTDARPSFWRVSFPPEDWSPRHPDAKSHKR